MQSEAAWGLGARCGAALICASLAACSSVLLESATPDAGDSSGNGGGGGQGGPAGPRGPLGPVGPAGPPGATGKNAVIWKDAFGQRVPVVYVSVTDPRRPELYFTDASGMVWKIDADTASVTVAFDALSRVYDAPACGGTEYLYAPSSLGPRVNAVPPPRFTFKVSGDPTVRTRPDTLALSTLVPCSTRGAGACVSNSTCSGSLRSIPLMMTIPPFPLTPPSAFTGPLHPEGG